MNPKSVRLIVICGFLIAGYSALAGRAEAAQAREGTRRSAEGEAGARRSAETGRRDSSERGRSAEGERGPARAAEREGPRDGGGLRGFRPQTQREAALYQMILQLERQLVELRREVAAQRGAGRASEGPRDGDAGSRRPVGGDYALPPRWQYTKEGRVFQTYDKSGDGVVTLEEWLAVTNGNVSESRRQIQTKRFREAEPSGDGRFTPAEFIYWYSKGRFANLRDGDARARDGEGSRRGPRDGEGSARGPRDGDASQSRSRDGEREREGRERGDRDGE